ncbi:MAG: ABC transporter substrate-binding protein [Alphaproteobacteria bacterium]|nr:ABC transporter substrate-binding protein [Alphaproteobacteria bacterium]
MISRRLFSSLAAAATAVTMTLAVAPTSSAADPAAEQYVAVNANQALQTLSDRSLTAADRQARFRALMQRFADVPSISNFVLGPAAAQLRADPALNREWQTVFMDYSVAVYEDQLDQFRDNEVRVATGTSVERVPGRDVIVKSTIVPRGASQAMPVQWRIVKRGEAWKVVDVSLVLDRNEVWLAQRQQQDFRAILGPRGDVRALIAAVRGQTKDMRDRITARQAGRRA